MVAFTPVKLEARALTTSLRSLVLSCSGAVVQRVCDDQEMQRTTRMVSRQAEEPCASPWSVCVSPEAVPARLDHGSRIEIDPLWTVALDRVMAVSRPALISTWLL